MAQNNLTKQLIELSGSWLFCQYQLLLKLKAFIINIDATEIYVDCEFRRSILGVNAAIETTMVHAGQEHHNHVLQSVLGNKLKNLWNQLKEIGCPDDPDFIKLEANAESEHIL